MPENKVLCGVALQRRVGEWLLRVVKWGGKAGFEGE